MLTPLLAFGKGERQLERRFKILAFLLPIVFPSAGSKLTARGYVFAPRKKDDKKSPSEKVGKEQQFGRLTYSMCRTLIDEYQ
jgi:hypothetical protein